MSLLVLENVSKRYREGRRERTVLDGVDLEVREGELVFVYGVRRSGRSTLLRTAAGIETPDAGRVLFAGSDLAAARRGSLGDGIGYVAKALRSGEEPGVLAQVAAPLLARGTRLREARERARAALARAGAERAGGCLLEELSVGESVRVALARALVLSPALLVIDEPAAAVELSERGGVLAQLRSLAGEGTAVLASTGEPDEMAGAHRALTLSDGRLRGPATAELAPVVALRRGI
jgi:putative ABC transport system ATP-binding protein